MGKRTLKVAINSEGEEYLVNELFPNCKDKVECKLGEIYGVPWNEYTITKDDYYRIQNYILNKKGA